MRADFGLHHVHADVLRLSSDEEIVARMTFDTEEKKVVLDWSFKAAPDVFGSVTHEHFTSFEPTALIRKQGVGASFFVAGYVERSGMVVVEEWTATDLATNVTYSPVGLPISGLTYDLRREVVVTSGVIAPVRGMVYHGVLDTLLLFEESALDTVWTVDIGTGTFSVLFDNTTYPRLEAANHAFSFYNSEHGFIVMLDVRPIWLFGELSLAEAAETVMLMRDSNFDGVFDEIDEDFSWSEFETRGFSSGLDTTYEW